MYLNYDVINKNVKTAILQIYESTWSVENIINICFEKNMEKTLTPFFVNTVGSIIQRVYIKSGYFYEYLLKELITNSYNSDGSCKYKLLDECNSRLIEQIGLNLLTLKEEKCDRDVDLLFQDIGTGKVYYLEIKKRDNQDSTKKDATIRKFLDTKNSLELTYKNLEGFIVFIEKERVNKYNNLDGSYILSGNTFYKKFFNLTVDDVNSYLTNIIKSEDIQELYIKAENIIKYFYEKSKVMGALNAGNLILNKHRNGSLIA